MFSNSMSDYAPVSSAEIALKPQEMHFFSFKVTAVEKQGMGYQPCSDRQYLCHFTDQRFIFEPVIPTQQSKFEVAHDEIARFKLVRTIGFSSYAKLIFKSSQTEVATSEWTVAVSPVQSAKPRNCAKDFVQIGNELIGVAPGGFQIVAEDPTAIAQFKQDVEASNLPVVIDFVASKCEPCRVMAPVVNELKEQFAGKFNLIKVDIEEQPAIAVHYGINCFPTLLILNAGTVIDQIAGVVPKPVLVKVLNNHLARL